MFRELHEGIKKVYLSDIIVDEKDKSNEAVTHQQKIRIAQTYLEGKNIKVMNPAVLPTGFDYQDYLPIKFKMMDCCDAVIMLRDWEKSKIARIERVYAQKTNKPVYYFDAITAEDALNMLKELRHVHLTEMVGDPIDVCTVTVKDYLALDWAIAQIEVILGCHISNNKPSCFRKEVGELFCSQRIDDYCSLCDLNAESAITDILQK